VWFMLPGAIEVAVLKASGQGSIHCPHYIHYFTAGLVCSSLSHFLCWQLFALHCTCVYFLSTRKLVTYRTTVHPSAILVYIV
jgi:hypothetical protein